MHSNLYIEQKLSVKGNVHQLELFTACLRAMGKEPDLAEIDSDNDELVNRVKSMTWSYVFRCEG